MGLANPSFAADSGPFTGGPFLPRGAFETVGPTRERPTTFLGRTQGEPGLHLALASLPADLREPVPLLGGWFVVWAFLGGGQPDLEFTESALVAGHRLPRLFDRGAEPLSLGVCRTGRRAQLAQSFGDGRELRVGLVQAGQCALDPSGGLGPLLLGLRPLGAESIRPLAGLAQAFGRVVHRRLDLQQAGLRT